MRSGFRIPDSGVLVSGLACGKGVVPVYVLPTEPLVNIKSIVRLSCNETSMSVSKAIVHGSSTRARHLALTVPWALAGIAS